MSNTQELSNLSLFCWIQHKGEPLIEFKDQQICTIVSNYSDYLYMRWIP